MNYPRGPHGMHSSSDDEREARAKKIDAEAVKRWPFRYEIRDEFNQVIAATMTRWIAEMLIAGMKASDSPTWAEGRYSIAQLDQTKGEKP